MGAESEEAELMEKNFFDTYWPGATLPSTAATSLAGDQDMDDRVPKQARTAEAKGQPGGKGHTSAGKRRERDDGSGGGQSWGRGGWGQRKWDVWADESLEKTSTKELKEEIQRLKDSVFSLQRMVLRQEDFSSCIKQELAWVMFMKLDMRASVVPCLFQMQQAWRELKEKHPERLKAPMRVDLVKALFREFGKRLEHLPQHDSQLGSLEKLGWLQTDPLRWSRTRGSSRSQTESRLSSARLLPLLGLCNSWRRYRALSRAFIPRERWRKRWVERS